MTSYEAPPLPMDAIASKVQYTVPEGDENIVESRQTSIFRSDQPSYNGGGVAKLWIYSNGQCIDLANSYFMCNISVSIQDGTGTDMNLLHHKRFRPILTNGIQDLINSWRVRSYGGVDMEYIRFYNQAAQVKKWCTLPPTNEMALSRLTMSGDCLSFNDGLQLIDNSANPAANLGLRVAFRPEMSGFFNTRRLLPLRYMNQVQFEIGFERAEQAFCVLAGNNTTTPPTIKYTITNLEFYADMVTLSPDMEVAMKKAVEDDQGLPIYFDTLEVQQESIGTSQQYTQRINKAVANAVRVMSILQPSAVVNDPRWDGFASQPMGIQSYQYRLGTTYYPRDKVDLTKGNMIRAVIEADKAMNYSNAKREVPPSDVLQQIGDSMVISSTVVDTKNLGGSVPVDYTNLKGLSRVNGTDPTKALVDVTGAGSSLDRTLNYQLYRPQPWAVPSRFRFGTSLQSSPDAWITGVSTAHGHQLELFLTRANQPTQSYNWALSAISVNFPTPVPTAAASRKSSVFETSNGAGTINNSTDVSNMRGGSDTTLYASQISKGADDGHVGAMQNTFATNKSKFGSQFYWGGSDSALLTTFLQYTRLILIKPDYNIAIRE